MQNKGWNKLIKRVGDVVVIFFLKNVRSIFTLVEARPQCTSYKYTVFDGTFSFLSSNSPWPDIKRISNGSSSFEWLLDLDFDLL